MSTPRVNKRLLDPAKEPVKPLTLQPKVSKESIKAPTLLPKDETSKNNNSDGSSDLDTENADVILMKFMVFTHIGITFVVLMVLVVLLLFQFCPKCRKRNAEVRKQTVHLIHSDVRMKAVGLHPTCKMESNFPPPLLPSLEVTDQLGVPGSSSGIHTLDLSDHRYSDIHLTDTMKRKMLQDPFVTGESKEKVKKELTENEKLLKNSTKVSFPSCKMNSDFPPPLLPSNEVTDERGVSVSSSSTHSLDLSEHEYSYIHLTDTMKKKMLQDPFVTAESKKKVKQVSLERKTFTKFCKNVNSTI